ncbi:MAG: heparinase II/III family protein [Armatimonadota bacterium]
MRTVAVGLVAVMILTGTAYSQGEVMPWTELHRVPLPDELPPHPRVFCTQAEIDRIRADYEAGDPFTRLCVDEIVSRAEAAASAVDESGRPTRHDFARTALLAQASALTGDERFGRMALERLLHAAEIAPELEPTRARGLFTDSTLAEGPLAVDAAMAWDLIAGAEWITEKQRAQIEDDLLRRIGWESGHRCGHRNSSNWRSWALAIVASCGFATGDRELIDEAVNGAWDPQRNAYLYGAVQQIAHSIFADGIHWERSVGYSYYTASALQWVLLAAENSGIDLWHAEIPGILGPFEGGANHEEFGPPGARSIKYMLDAQFYQAFPDLSFARINDSGTRRLAYHPIYELAWERYRDPKYAWLISRERERDEDAPAWWSLWRPAGEGEAGAVDHARSGSTAWRMTTGERGRVALVQNVTAPAARQVTVGGWVRTLEMDGASAHIRCNFDGETVFTTRVTEAGEWRRVECTIDPVEGAEAGQTRSIRLHVFLEGGAGEVIWDDITVHAGDAAHNYARNPGFEARATDGRGTSFFDLVHAPAEVPEGHFSLADDATIGLVGTNESGCTNFPVGGFTILRSDPIDEDAPAVNLTWGPYGSGHDHPDRLAIAVYGQGRILCPDAGSWGYDDPMHLTWANQTIAHNTLTVDEVSQYPQEDSDSIWASERGDRRVFGVQHLFHAGEHLKAARFTCETAYDGVTMDRTVCLVGGYLVDIFRATSEDERLYDLALHGAGALTTNAVLAGLSDDALTARGYEHFTNARGGEAPNVVRAIFADDDASLLMLQTAPDGAQIIAADDPVKSGMAPTSCVISRVRGQDAVWVSVLEPFAESPSVEDLSVSKSGEGLLVRVTHREGADSLTLPSDPGGALRLLRQGPTGEEIASDEAVAAAAN